MMLPTHIISTAATTTLLMNHWGVHSQWMFALGFLAGGLPDLDLLYYMAFKKRKNSIFGSDSVNHRQTFMHAPLFYLAIFFPLLLISQLIHSVELYQVVVLLSVGVFSHILMDMVWVGGVPLLWPFDLSMHGFFIKSSQKMLAQYVKKHGNDWMAFYMHHPLFYFEIFYVAFMFIIGYVSHNIVLGSVLFFLIPSMLVQLKQRKIKRELSGAM